MKFCWRKCVITTFEGKSSSWLQSKFKYQIETQTVHNGNTRTVGLSRHRLFVGSFNVAVQSPTRGYHIYGFFFLEPPIPHFGRRLRRALGYGGPIHILNPRVPTGKVKKEMWGHWKSLNQKSWLIWKTKRGFNFRNYCESQMESNQLPRMSQWLLICEILKTIP